MHKYTNNASMITANFCLLLVTILISGCATIFTGKTDDITFTTNTDPVRVFIGGRNVGTTPLTIEVHRQTQKGPLVSFVKEGYETQEFKLEQKFNWVSVLDVLSPLTSGGVDVLTGAMMEFSPTEYHVELIKANQASNDDRQRQVKFSAFVIFNTRNIQKDLANGTGEYSSALEAMIDRPEPGKLPFASWLDDNKEKLISANNPEQFLALLRNSHMTP